MAKYFDVKFYKGGSKSDGTKVPEFVNAKRAQVIDALNTPPEFRPRSFRDVPAKFTYFNFHKENEGAGFREFIVRIDGTDVTDDVKAWVEHVLQPGWNQDVANAISIRRYRAPRSRRNKLDAALNLVLTMAETDDKVERENMATQVVDIVKEVAYS